MENKAKSSAASLEKNTGSPSHENVQRSVQHSPEKSWMKDLNLKPEDFSQCPEDQNPLLWAFESELLQEQTYTDWASVAYELPVLKSEFFELGWDKTLRATFQDVFPWEKDCFPVYKWEDVLYVACLEPQQIPVDAKVCFLIASPTAMMTAWENLEEIHQEEIHQEESHQEELQQNQPHPQPPVAPADTITPHTSEIVAAHPDLEPSVLNFDMSALDLGSPAPPESTIPTPEPIGPVDALAPLDANNATEELTQEAAPNFSDDLNGNMSEDLSAEPAFLESADLSPTYTGDLDFGDLNLESPSENAPPVETFPAETPPAEAPSLVSLDDLDFGDLDLGGPPPPVMEAEPATPNGPQAANIPLETPPSFEDLDLSALAPTEQKPEATAQAVSPPPGATAPASISSETSPIAPPEAPILDFDFDIPAEKTAPTVESTAPAAIDLSKVTPASAQPIPPEPLETEAQPTPPPAPKFSAPEPPIMDLPKVPVPLPKLDGSKVAVPAPPVEAAPTAATAKPPIPVTAPTPPLAFDDDKTPPPVAKTPKVPTPIAAVPGPETSKTMAVSTAPSDKSITWDHLKGGPELESCESLPQIVEHIFAKVHRDFEKLMWIPKSKTKGFIPDLVMGPWSPKDETWTTSVDIRNANIFRVAWSSKLPFHGPVSPNTTNNKYFEMWDKGAMPEHITIFPLCTEAKKCLGFIVGCGKGASFDKKETLKRFQRLMELTAKQLGATALDKAA